MSIIGCWSSEDDEKLISELKKILELRSESDIALHGEEIRIKGIQIN